MKVTLGIREIDLSKALPLKLRDWRILEKKGITAKTLENTSIEAVAELVFLVLNKADGTVTMEEVDDLELDSDTFKQVIEAINKKKVVKAFLTPSISSAPITDGQ